MKTAQQILDEVAEKSIIKILTYAYLIGTLI